MSDIKRVRKIINWLIFREFASNERELAELMGYTKSSFSQLINGKVPLSDKFIENLVQIDGNINKVWIMDEVGNMFKNYNLIGDVCAPALYDNAQEGADGDGDEGMMSRLKKLQSKDGGDVEVVKIGMQEIEMLYRWVLKFDFSGFAEQKNPILAQCVPMIVKISEYIARFRYISFFL